MSMLRKGTLTFEYSCKGYSYGQECFLFLCSLQCDDKNAISLMEPVQRFVGPVKVFCKEVISGRRERGSHSHAISLLLKLPMDGELCGSEIFCSTGPEGGLSSQNSLPLTTVMWEQMVGNIVVSEVDSLMYSD